jgi:hypothetical protein
MEQDKLTSFSLLKAIHLNLPDSIIVKCKACLDEDASYAADELVELAEEILSQVAAIGFMQYLKSNAQKEVYNDFLLQLFTSQRHDYNSGPLYRWAANMILECTDMRNDVRFKYFWETIGNKYVLCDKVHSLAELRNRVMHGFFVLPPDENKRIANDIGNLLIGLCDASFFKTDANYHFIQKGQFTGRWDIQKESDWQLLNSDSSFGKLIAQILIEKRDFFWEQELEKIESNITSTIPIPDKLESFIQSNQGGAFACWVHPNHKNVDSIYSNIANWLQQQKDTITLAYTIHPTGISFTSEFLMERLVKLLNISGKALSNNRKFEEHIKQLRSEYKGKVVILVNTFHIALFSKQHITYFINFLFDNNILFVGVGHHYEHFNKFFNQSVKIEHITAVPDAKQRFEILHNYLRFKGPHTDKKEDAEAVKILRNILDKLCDTLVVGGEVYARKFADENKYDMEYVHEIFSLLHPWVKGSRKPFEEDTVDELYGFPSIITETTPIYLALGRRDLKLEYQHKVISL